MSKREIRSGALRDRRSLASQQVEMMSARVEALLTEVPEYLEALTIASYVAKPDEVQTRGIIESALASGKRVIVPRSDRENHTLTFREIRSFDELETGSFGVLEPRASQKDIDLAQAQLILVPVVAWDKEGQRVGYGKGYFDRELKHKGRAAAAGLAFESQRRERLPTSALDVPLDLVVTEKTVYRFGKRSHD